MIKTNRYWHVNESDSIFGFNDKYAIHYYDSRNTIDYRDI